MIVYLHYIRQTQTETCECGSEFDLDYRNKHEAKQHNGQRKKIKHVDAPENPFQAAKRVKQVLMRQFQKQCLQNKMFHLQ